MIKKAEDISEKPSLEAPETKLTDAKAENLEENTAEIEGEEEMQDLGGSDDDEKDDEKQDPEEIEREEIKKETMSVMNTVLDEEAEKNLHDAIEFKEYTGCPKNNGTP